VLRRTGCTAGSIEPRLASATASAFRLAALPAGAPGTAGSAAPRIVGLRGVTAAATIGSRVRARITCRSEPDGRAEHDAEEREKVSHASRKVACVPDAPRMKDVATRGVGTVATTTSGPGSGG